MASKTHPFLADAERQGAAVRLAQQKSIMARDLQHYNSHRVIPDTDLETMHLQRRGCVV